MSRKFGGAGSGDKIDTGALAAEGASFTTGAYVYYDGFGSAEHVIISNYSTTFGQSGMELRIEPSTDTVEFLVKSGFGVTLLNATDLKLPKRQWTFVGAKFNDSTLMNAYVGESKSLKTATPGASPAVASQNNCLIGASDTSANHEFGGYLSDAFVSVGELFADAEMLEIGRGKKSIIHGKLSDAASRYLPLLGSPSTEPDLSGNSHDGTVTGTLAGQPPPRQLIKSTKIIRSPFYPLLVTAAPGVGRIMGSIAGPGGLAGMGGIAGSHGGIAG